METSIVVIIVIISIVVIIRYPFYFIKEKLVS